MHICLSELIAKRRLKEINSHDKTISEENINLLILEKVKMIDSLDADEKTCLLKMIDIAIAKKKMKDTLSTIITS